MEDMEYRLTLPETLADPAAYQRLIREYNALTDTVTAYRAFRSLEARLHEAEEEALSSDAELRALATEEALSVKKQLAEAETALRTLLIPRDPDDDRSVVMEIRAGTGGEEAALFAADLFRMYSMYAQSVGFSVSVTSATEKARSPVSNSNRACIACSVSPRPNPRDASKPPPQRWLCCRKRRRWMWRSGTAILCLSPANPPVRADSTSTRPSPPSA